jgi:hypothetical protein
MHRRESWGPPMLALAAALRRLADERPDVRFVVLLHPNPIVRAAFEGLDRGANVVLCEPLPYRQFIRLLAMARVVVTDSGGVQEEAPALGVPVLVVRDRTERVEGLATGSATLVGTSPAGLTDHLRLCLDDPVDNVATDVYGDGRAAHRCVATIERFVRDLESSRTAAPSAHPSARPSAPASAPAHQLIDDLRSDDVLVEPHAVDRTGKARFATGRLVATVAGPETDGEQPVDGDARTIDHAAPVVDPPVAKAG